MITGQFVVGVALLTALSAPVSMTGSERPTPVANDVENRSIQVTLTWHARQEEGVYGYLVYRADRREGPYIRINREIVHARGVESEIADYRFVDTDVQPGRTYYYYLDIISSAGHKLRFSGVISKAVASADP